MGKHPPSTQFSNDSGSEPLKFDPTTKEMIGEDPFRKHEVYISGGSKRKKTASKACLRYVLTLHQWRSVLCTLAAEEFGQWYLLEGPNMSFTGPSVSSGGRTARRAFEFGRTYVVKPKGKHQATVVWLHGLGDNGSSWSQLLESLPLPNIKWICPTAPTQPIAVFGGFPSTAWFDVGEFSEDAPDDVEGLDASAAHVANLLSTEPDDIKLGVGGFSMGAATALYSATCFSTRKYGNGNQYPCNLSAVVGLSGWLPCSKTLSKKLEEVDEAARRAASIPLLLCHGKSDDVVPYKFGEKSSQSLRSNGFQDVTFKSYNALGHYTIPEEMDEVCAWLRSKLGLDGTSS